MYILGLRFPGDLQTQVPALQNCNIVGPVRFTWALFTSWRFESRMEEALVLLLDDRHPAILFA